MESQNFLQKNSKGIMVGIIAVLVVIIMFSFGDQTKTENEVKTIDNTEQLEKQQLLLQQQQAAIEFQNKKIAEQERIEKERKLNELSVELSKAYDNLEKAKTELNTVSGFKLLRSASTRDSQIRTAQETISIYENDITELEKQIKKVRSN